MQNYNSSILGSIATGVVTLGPDGRVIFINGAGEKIFSSTETGKMYDEFFNSAQNTELTTGIHKVLHGSESEYKAYHAQFVRPVHGLVALHGTHVVPATVLAAWYPAWRGSQTPIAEAVREE